MDSIPVDAVRYAVLGIVLLVVLLVGRRVWRWYSTKDERELEVQLQAAINAGDLKLAGDIQLRRGLIVEAARIFLRAGEHLRAANVLLKLGDEKQAADEFEKAEEWGRAAPLFRKTGNLARAAACFERSSVREHRIAAAECHSATNEHLKAGRIYQDLEEYALAADCFAKVEDLVSLDVALTMLENAALSKTPDPERRKDLWRRAGELAVKAGAHERAARAFDESGELARAAKIYETALKKLDLAAALFSEAGEASEAARLTEAAGGPTAVLELRLTRARARGDKGLTEELETEFARLGSAVAPTKVLTRADAGGEPAGTANRPARGGGGPRFDERFELLGELGRGGMGVVYRAKDRKLGRYVAMKFLPEDVEHGSTLHRLFHREARAAASLTHPAIVTVYDVGELEGREFIAMELVEGDTLDRALDAEGPMPFTDALDVMEKVLVAMEYAHGKSVIHRDLKPANLMRSKGAIKVMDFGLAKIVSGRSSSGGTVIGGTPSYMPPEQQTGHADHRSDVFALGATFYELISGVLPGNPGEPASTTTNYPTLRERVPAVPARLSDLIMRCLEHDRQVRPQDMASVLGEVRQIRTEIARARPTPPAVRQRTSPVTDVKPKPVEEPRKRAPLPRIAREEEDDPPRVERVERVGRVPVVAAPPTAAAARRPIPREDIIEVVDTDAIRGKPR